jgi:tetratricopeptide (TPR) repeat protein
VLWAGSGQTTTGTPFALEGGREVVRGYVLYYGAGAVQAPRIDVPVFVVRAGLDVPALNRSLDSLTQKLTNAGVPLTVVNYSAGQHGFDLYDNSEMTARVIAQTLDFMVAVTTPGLHEAIVASVPDMRAAAAFTAQRWPDAERLYGELVRTRPDSRFAVWRLGLSQLENGKPDRALASFDRARELGQGGARDIGLPAARAAVRAGQTMRAVEWLQWALRSFPRIRAEIEADAELAPLLQHPRMRGTDPLSSLPAPRVARE